MNKCPSRESYISKNLGLTKENKNEAKLNYLYIHIYTIYISTVNKKEIVVIIILMKIRILFRLQGRWLQNINLRTNKSKTYKDELTLVCLAIKNWYSVSKLYSNF